MFDVTDADKILDPRTKTSTWGGRGGVKVVVQVVIDMGLAQ